MKYILGLAAALVLLVSCASTPPNKYAKQFNYACAAVSEIMEEDACVDLAAPLVVVTKHMQPGILGIYYDGEPYVFVRSNINPDNLVTIEDVAVHEMVHYIVYHYDSTTERCEHERLARIVTAAYSGIAIDPNWEIIYNCEV